MNKELQDKMKELSDNYCDSLMPSGQQCTRINYERGFKDCAKILAPEIEKLKKIIAKHPSESDDLGAEFTHVLILKEENEKLKKQLEIAREALVYYSDFFGCSARALIALEEMDAIK